MIIFQPGVRREGTADLLKDKFLPDAPAFQGFFTGPGTGPHFR